MIKLDELNKILCSVIDDALCAGIPVDPTTERKVYIDYNVTNRAGFCNWCFKKYEIHITDRLLNANIKIIKDVLAHEVLHTCFLAKNHYFPWSEYANIMNKVYGYNIKDSYNGWKEIGVIR